ncbi:putative fatty acyl-CoA reductase 7 [Lycium barbarum]|uniref:putative fatty acyl-CoA reductase 7 n=1 Tax=Lycium barbarum TaxID=112863 RepID=UPI00293EF725|nr:putative fatty acyl-CoA reductase 7 [Lycium barbarum]
MELFCINQFLEGKTIFISGATGYLAKILTEKILRLQPHVKRLYLLIRAPNSNSAKERFNNEVLSNYYMISSKEKLGPDLHGFIEEKVFPVAGDIACDGDSLGINSELKDEMCREIDIIVNSAATTRFDERYRILRAFCKYDTAIRINTLGAVNVVKFSKQCTKLKMLLHVSTACVCSEREGLILEKPLNYGETLNGSSRLDIDVEKKLVEETLKDLQGRNATEKEVTLAMRILGIERLHGWPNTYTFTKAMGGMLLGHLKEDLQLIILRPTIILSTYKEPFPGWIEGYRGVDTFIVGYGKGKQNVAQVCISYVIPADMVVNSVIAAMVTHRVPSSHTAVYHISSSRRNQLKLGDVVQFVVDYFKKNPWIDERGKPIKVKKFHLLDSTASLHKYIAIRYMPILNILKLANLILFQYLQAVSTTLERSINRAIRLAELHKPYALFKGIFDDTNAEILRMATREINADDTFNFDPRTIQWENYLKEIHIPGLVKYIF